MRGAEKLARAKKPHFNLSGRQREINYLQDILQQNNIPVSRSENPTQLSDKMVTFVVGSVLNGFEFPQSHLVVISEKDILGRQKKKLKPRQSAKSAEGKIAHFRDINIGDYVVHVNHGIGKYLGVETLTIGNVHRDYLHIKYSGTDKLFVPTDQVHLIQKYIGSEGEVPRLSKMNSTAWKKPKRKRRLPVENIAKDLINLYAQRKNGKGFAFAPDTPWQKEFEDAFPYEETPDQLRAIREIKADMEKPVPMDRLLCGDVGGLRQDGSRHPRRVQSRDERQTGRRTRADDGARAAALIRRSQTALKASDRMWALSAASTARKSRKRRWRIWHGAG